MNRERIDELSERWRDSRLDEEQTRELNQLLRTSAQARERFRTQAHFHGLLHNAVAAASVEKALNVVTGGQALRRRWFAASLRLAAAGLVLAVSVSVILWQVLGRTTIGPVVATLDVQSGARLSYADGAVVPTSNGQALHAATYALDAGIMQLAYENGAHILLQAPARFELSGPQLLRLHRGRLTARVPETAIGFTVITPTANVVDLGTEFGVTVGENASEVHVFEGEVLVNTANEPDPLLLRENRASRIDLATRTPTGVDFRPLGFMRTIADPPSELSERLRKLAPLALYRMSPTEDGRTLPDDQHGKYPGQVFAQVGQVPWAAGFDGGTALSLNGAEAKVFAVIPAFPKTTSHALTVCAWVYANRRPRWGSIVKNWSKEGNVNNGGQFHFGLHRDDGDLEAHVHDASGQEVQVRENQPLPLDQWHFVAFTCDGAMLRLYRNGIELAATPCRGLSQYGPNALGIGVKLRDESTPDPRTAGFWDGRIDNVAIFHRALSAAEVVALSE